MSCPRPEILGSVLFCEADWVRLYETVPVHAPEHFGAAVFIHEADRAAAPYADQILSGREPVPIADDLLAIPVPGHTEGSVVYLYDQRCLFTGDSLAWSFERNDLAAFRDVCMC